MPGENAAPITRLLAEAAAGDPRASGEVLSAVYDTLKQIARHRMTAERVDHTLQATALVHECYLRLFGNALAQFVARAQFFYAAAEAMQSGT